MFKEEIIQILYNLFQRTETEGIIPNSFSETSITIIPKQKIPEENFRPISFMSIDAKILHNEYHYTSIKIQTLQTLKHHMLVRMWNNRNSFIHCW